MSAAGTPVRAFWHNDGVYEQTLPESFNENGLSSGDENLLLEIDFKERVKFFIKSYQNELGTYKYKEELERNVSILKCI